MKYSKKKHRKKYFTELCDDNLTFQECELAILRNAVDETEKLQGRKIANSEDIKKILTIVEDFLAKKKLICYGGTAINNILPQFAQFYDRDVEIPDYDFYSSNALEDAKELADLYYKEGYEEVEAKSGVHLGTFKVFVDFIPIADITQLDKRIYDEIAKESITVDRIRYAPPNFLRMNMFLELSRPAGDVSRWEKVLKRLNLLNKHYPLNPDIDCNTIDFQRKLDSDSENSDKLYITVRDGFINQGVIFFGGYATSLYSRYMHEDQKHIAKQIPDFDVLSEEPNKTANIIEELLKESHFKHVKTIKHDAIGEIVPEHVEIRVGEETIAFIYKPIACHSYNIIHIDSNEVKVATIDTILSFYLAFTYIDEPYYDRDRLLCMAKFLFEVEQKNRLQQKGLLKRFSIDCYGKQLTMEEIRAEKANKYRELAKNRESKEFQQWFLKFNPAQRKLMKAIKTIKSKETTNKTKKRTPKKNNSFRKKLTEYLV